MTIQDYKDASVRLNQFHDYIGNLDKSAKYYVYIGIGTAIRRNLYGVVDASMWIGFNTHKQASDYLCEICVSRETVVN